MAANLPRPRQAGIAKYAYRADHYKSPHGADKSVQVSILNQRKIERALRAIGNDAVSELTDAHRAAAEIVERAARPKVPVLQQSFRSVVSNKPYWASSQQAASQYQRRYNVGYRAGDLKKTLRSGASSRAGVVRIGKKLVPYAGPIHYGWPSRPNQSKNWKGGPIPPNPFLHDALDERRQEVLDTFYRYLQGIVDRHLD